MQDDLVATCRLAYSTPQSFWKRALGFQRSEAHSMVSAFAIFHEKQLTPSIAISSLKAVELGPLNLAHCAISRSPLVFRLCEVHSPAQEQADSPPKLEETWREQVAGDRFVS